MMKSPAREIDRRAGSRSRGYNAFYEWVLPDADGDRACAG
jgi:hypothetical protein